MVADIHLLQGKIVEDPEKRTKNVARFIEELALEILSEEDLARPVTIEPESRDQT